MCSGDRQRTTPPRRASACRDGPRQSRSRLVAVHAACSADRGAGMSPAMGTRPRGLIGPRYWATRWRTRHRAALAASTGRDAVSHPAASTTSVTGPPIRHVTVRPFGALARASRASRRSCTLRHYARSLEAVTHRSKEPIRSAPPRKVAAFPRSLARGDGSPSLAGWPGAPERLPCWAGRRPPRYSR